MITAQPRLYYNTHLRTGDVLDYTSRLESDSTVIYRDFDVHIGLQDFFLTSFKLKATWDDVKNADYMKFGNAYYWITPVMINENCAKIYCQLDALTSMGGAMTLTYRGGRVKRYHPENSIQFNYFANTCDEPVGCSQILKAVHMGRIDFTNGNSTINVIASTVKLDDPNVSLSPNIDRDALVFSGDIGITPGADKYSVVIPKPPEPADYTTFYGFDTSTRTVGFGLYDGDNAVVKRNLQYIRALGLSDAILFSYTIPLGAVSPVVKDTNGHITSIGQSYALVSGDMGWRAGASDSVESGFGGIQTGGDASKLFYKAYSLYTSYVVRGRLSGDIKTFKASEIHSDNGNVQFDWVADPQYGGTAYCGPHWYYGSTDALYRFGNAAKGLPWKEVPISFNGASGELWNRNAYNLGQSEILRSQARVNQLNDSMGTGLLTNASGFIGTIGAYIASVANPSGGTFEQYAAQLPANMDPREYQQAKEKASYLQSQVVAPELSCSPAIGLQSFIANGFDVIKLIPTDSDAQNINDYFVKFGYAVPNIPFKKSMLSTRSDFNYIEVSDIEITTGDVAYGRAVVDAAMAQLQGGVKVWHKMPSIET